jgi:hypothetical protein
MKKDKQSVEKILQKNISVIAEEECIIVLSYILTESQMKLLFS